MTACVIAALATAPGTLNFSRLNAQNPKVDPKAAPDVSKTLKGVEERYNHAQTLEVGFSESITVQGHKRTETGELYLRKPGRMRWQYTQPAGKLFVSDGKYIYLYDPAERHAERQPFKESEDMRAPLAFLLGKLNFHDDFGGFKETPDDPARGTVFITAIPKSDKLPYSEVTFSVTPDFVIHYLSVKGQDGSTTEFVFENEKRNPTLSDALFKFTPPKGVAYEEIK